MNMNIHRLRVVDYDTPVRKLEGTSTIIERDEESSNDQKDENGARVDNKNTTSEENGGGDQSATCDSATCPAPSRRLCLLKRRSKSELFRLPSHPKLKKLAPKNTCSSEDLKKTSKNKDRSNHRSRYNLVFNRDSILNLHSKGGDVKRKKNSASKNEEMNAISDSEKTNLSARVINQRKEKNNTPKLSNDAFGFQKTNKKFDPCLYQMSCHFLDIDNHSTLNMLKKRFRYKQLRKKQHRQQEPSNDVQNKHQQLRVLNSQVFHSPEKEVDKYYNLIGYGTPHKITYEKPHKTQPTRKIYKDAWRRNYTNMNLRKDANVFVSSSVLVPRRKYCIERACGCSPINIVSDNQSPSQSKKPIVKSESVTSERQKMVTEIVNCITSGKVMHPIKRAVKKSMKNICLGLLIVVWSPCLLAVILALIIMSPWRLTKLLDGNTASKTSCPNNSFFDKCKPKCLVHECQRICSNYTKSQQKSILSSVAGWFTRVAGTAAASYQATLSLVKLNKNRHPTCAGSSFLPKTTYKHPNPKTRYNLYYANDRGWVMKPVHHRKQYQDMRCEYSPKIRHSSRLCARLMKRRSSEVCCTSKDMISEVKPSKPKVDECACSEVITKNRGDGCCCTTPISNPSQTKKKQVNITPGQSSPTVNTKPKSNVLCSCMHNQITTNMNTVRLNKTACLPVSHFVRPHYCVGMLYGVTTNYPCIAQNIAPHIGSTNNEQTKISPNNIKKHQSTSIDNIPNTSKTTIGRTQFLPNLQTNTTQTVHIPKLDMLHSSQGQTMKSYPSRQACGISNQARLVDTNFPIKMHTYQQTSIPRAPYTSKIDLFHVLQNQASKYSSNKQESSSPPYTIGGLVDKAISYTPSIIAVEHIVKKNETNLRNKSVRYNTVVDKYHPNLQSNKPQLYNSENISTCAIEKSTDRHENVIECLSKSIETTQKKSLSFIKPSKFSQTKKSAFMIQSQGTMFPSNAVLQTSKCNYSKKTNKFMSFINGKRDPNNLVKCCPCEYQNSNNLPLCQRKENQIKSSMHKIIPFIKGLALSYKQKIKNLHQQKGPVTCPCKKNKTERCPPLSKISECSHPTKSLEIIKCPCDMVAETRLKKCFSVDDNHSIKARASQLLQKTTDLARKRFKTSTAPVKKCESKSTITSPSLENVVKRDMLTTKTVTSTPLEKELQRKEKKIPVFIDKATPRYNQPKKTTNSSSVQVTESRNKATNTRLSLGKAVMRVSKTIKTSTSSLQKVIEPQNKVTKKTSTQSLQKVIEFQSKVDKKTSSPSLQKITQPERKLTKKISCPSLQKLAQLQSKVTKKATMNTSPPAMEKLSNATGTALEKPPGLPLIDQSRKCFTNNKAKVTSFEKVECACKKAALKSGENKFDGPCPCELIRKPGTTRLPLGDINLTEKGSEPCLTQKVLFDKTCPCTPMRQYPQSNKKHHKKKAISCECKVRETDFVKKMPDLPDITCKSCEEEAQAILAKMMNQYAEVKETQTVISKNMSDKACPCEIIHQNTTDKSSESPCIQISRYPKLQQKGGKTANTSSSQEKKIECGCKEEETQTVNKKSQNACPCVHIRQSPYKTVASRITKKMSNKMKKKKAITCECRVKETQTDLVKKMSDKACPCSLINEYPKMEPHIILAKKTSDKACPCEIFNQYSKLCKAEGTSPIQADTKESALLRASQKETRLSLEKATVDVTKETIPLVKPLNYINKSGSVQKDLVIKKNQATETPQVLTKQYSRTNSQILISQSRQKLLTSYRRSKQIHRNRSTSNSSMNLKQTRIPKQSASKLPYDGIKQLTPNRVPTKSVVTQTKSSKNHCSQDPNNKLLLSPQNQSTPKASKMLLLNVSSPGSLSCKYSVILKTPTPTKISTQRSNTSYNRVKKTSKHNMCLRDSVRRIKESPKPQSVKRLASQKLLFSHDHTTHSEIDSRFVPRSISRHAKTNKPRKSISRVSLFSNSEVQNHKYMSRKLSSGSVCSLHASNNLHQQSYRPSNLKSRFPRYSVRAVPSETKIKSKIRSRDVSTASSSSQFRSLKSQITKCKTKLVTKRSPFYLPQFNRWRSVSKPTEHEKQLLGDPSCSTIFNPTSSEESSKSQQLPLLNNMPNQPVIATCTSPDRSAWISSQKSDVEKQFGISNLNQFIKQSALSKSTQIHRITPIPSKTNKCIDLPEKVTNISSKCNQTSKHLFFVTDNISNNCFRTTRKLQPQSRFRRKTILKDSSQQTFARHLLVHQRGPSMSEQGTGMSGLRISVQSKQSLPKHSYRQTGFENKPLENKVQNIPKQQSRSTQKIEPIPTVPIAQNTLHFAPYYISPYSNMLVTQCYGDGGLEVPQQLVSAPLLYRCPLLKQNDSSVGCPILKQNYPSFGCALSTQTDHSYASPLSKQTNYPPIIQNDPCYRAIFKMQQSTQTCEKCQSHRKPKVVECKCYDSKYLSKKQSVDSYCKTKREKIKCGCFDNSKLPIKIECECYDQVQADRLVLPSTVACTKGKCTYSTQKPSSEKIICECFDENNKGKQKTSKDVSPKITCESFTQKQSSEKIECECKKMANRQSRAIPEKKSEIKLPNLPGTGAPLVYQKPVQAKIQKCLAKEPSAHHGEKRKKTTFNQADIDRSIERQRRKMIMKQMKVKAAIKKIKNKKHPEPSCWEQIKETVKETEEDAWPLEVTCNPMYIHTLKHKPHLWLFKLCPTMYPHFLNVFKVHSCMCQMFLYVITACSCCPVFLCLYYCCRGIACGVSG